MTTFEEIFEPQPLLLATRGIPATAAAAAVAAAAVASAARTLPLTVEKQKASNWCWAAVAFSVDRYEGGTAWTQCDLANRELSKTGCCADPDPCDTPHRLDFALTTVGHLAYWAVGTTPFPRVRSEIDASRPLCCRIGWQGTASGHFVVIRGYSEGDERKDLEIDDPIDGPSTYDYDEFTTRYRQTGAWTHTYFVS
jgi:hypothetical protein